MILMFAMNRLAGDVERVSDWLVAISAGELLVIEGLLWYKFIGWVF